MGKSSLKMDTRAEEQVTELRQRVLEMYVRVESILRLALRSVRERDLALGRSVPPMDEAIDQLELEIDSRCLELLSTASLSEDGLREIMTILKMVTDLERIGDLAVNISQRGLLLSKGPGISPPDQVLQMGDLVADMLRNNAEAFVCYEKKLVSRMQRKDDLVDALNRQVFDFGIETMKNHPDQADRALAVTSISKYIERVGDHSVNLATLILLMVKGKDLRHHA